MPEIDLNLLIHAAEDAISDLDTGDAKRALDQLNRLDIPQNYLQANPALARKINELSIKLRLVAFPVLADRGAEEVLRKYYLESYAVDGVYMEDQIIAKLFSIPYPDRDDLRESFKRALLENSQRIGPLTIGQWIQEFEKIYHVDIRNNASIIQFITQNNQAALLNASDKNKLKKILHTYTYLLVVTLPDIEPMLSRTLNSPNFRNLILSENPNARFGAADELIPGPYNIPKYQDTSKNIEVNFNEAIKNYPELGEQLVTSYRLNLKMFPDPVRPSIKNWISDYTFNVGYDHHDNMIRSNYLFQNTNAKNIPPDDREKLSYILKAFDENALVTINTVTRQIIFPEPEKPRSFPAPSAGINRTVLNPRQAIPPAPASPSSLGGPARTNFQPTPQNHFQPQPTPASRIFSQTNYQSPAFHNDMSNQMTIRRAAPNTEPEAWSIEHQGQKPINPLHEEPVSPEHFTIRQTGPIEPRQVQPSQVIRREAPNLPIGPEGQATGPLDTPIVKQPIFSSPQKLPYEKIQEPIKTPPPQTSPYHISSSLSLGNGNVKEEKPLPKNVVNLRG